MRMRTRQCGFERERAEAGVFLQLDKVQVAKHGTAVTCERTRKSHPLCIFEKG